MQHLRRKRMMEKERWNRIRVRIADNVLPNKHHTEYELKFEEDTKGALRVVAQRIVNPGVYGEFMVGWSMVRLQKWQSYDSTGDHPEVYHEVYDWRSKKYRSFMSVIDIKQLVEGDMSAYG